LPQYTFWTDKPTHIPTHGIGDRSTPRAVMLYYIDSEQSYVLIIMTCISILLLRMVILPSVL